MVLKRLSKPLCPSGIDLRPISLTLHGDPVGKARPRVRNTSSGHSALYSVDKTVQAQEQWKYLFLKSRAKAFPPRTPLRLHLKAYFRMPKSLPYRIDRVQMPVSRPDLDNIVKLVTDALEGLVYQNDSAIVSIQAEKHYVIYPNPPRTEVKIEVICKR